MDISKAEATVLREAIAVAALVITGHMDGKRRCPWDNHDMNADDGDTVPEELRTESSYWALFNRLDERLADIETGTAT